jgi:pimeloyl-ACP methyl ester carboxylesterase
LTQRGHGDSGRPDTGYRTQDFGADIAAVVDVLGLAAPVIVGHSMGATHALRFALDYPGTAAGLVLAGAFATYRDNPAVLDLWGSAISRLQDPVDAAFVRTFQEGTLAQRVPEPFLEMVVEESLKLPARVWRSTFEGFLDDEWTRHYARIGIPTLVLWGRHDALSPRRDQDALCAAISHARLLVYEAAGHALHWEEPARFAADLVSFTRRLHSSVAAPRY